MIDPNPPTDAQRLGRLKDEIAAIGLELRPLRDAATGDHAHNLSRAIDALRTAHEAANAASRDARFVGVDTQATRR